MVPRSGRGRAGGALHLPDQSHLVQAVESESVLRKGVRRILVRRAGNAFRDWTGGTVRHNRSQRQTERRVPGASAAAVRSLEEGSRPVARVSGDAANRFAT